MVSKQDPRVLILELDFFRTSCLQGIVSKSNLVLVVFLQLSFMHVYGVQFSTVCIVSHVRVLPSTLVLLQPIH